MTCKYCEKLCKNINSLKQHEVRCSKNENRITVNTFDGFLNDIRNGKRKSSNQFLNGSKQHHSKETIEKFKLLSTGRIHSKKTRDKISKSLTKFLEEHPDRVPYLLNHSSHQSYPESLFEKALIENNITGWFHPYQAGIYEYDFAFVDLKIDVEVDGETHLSEKVKLIDKRRDEWTKGNGWKVLRFTAKDIKSNITKCIELLKENLK